MLDLSLVWPGLQSYFAAHDPWMLPLAVLLVMTTPLLQTLLSNAASGRNGALYRHALSQRDDALRALEAERAAHAETRRKLDRSGDA